MRWRVMRGQGCVADGCPLVASPHPFPNPSPGGRGALGVAYWQASQLSGFSSEQATAASGVGTLTVDLAMRVAGLERR